MTVPSPTVIVGGEVVSTLRIAFSFRCAACSGLTGHERFGLAHVACVGSASDRIEASTSRLPGPAARVPSLGDCRLHPRHQPGVSRRYVDVANTCTGVP